MISCRPISNLSYIRCPYWGIFSFDWDLRIFMELHAHPHLRDTHWHGVSSVEPLGSYPVRPALRDVSMSSCFPFGRRPFDLWVWFSFTHGWLGSHIRWRVIWAHLVLLTYHTLCLIALMWAILGIDSRAFWLWWTRSYDMTLHWGIAISESFFFLSDDHYVEAYSSQSMTDFWATSIPRRISDVLFHIGAWDMIGAFHLVCFTQGIPPFSVDDGFRYGCSLEVFRFISHWSTRYDWVIYLMWSQEHSLLIIVDIFLRWLDQDTDTYENMQRSLVISGFALYWGITL